MVVAKKEHFDFYQCFGIPVENIVPDCITFSKRDYYQTYPKIRNLLLKTEEVSIKKGKMTVTARNVVRYEVSSEGIRLVAVRIAPDVMLYELSFLTPVENEKFKAGIRVFRNNRIHGLVLDEEELENEVHDIVTTFAEDFKVSERETSEFLKALHELITTE